MTRYSLILIAGKQHSKGNAEKLRNHRATEWKDLSRPAWAAVVKDYLDRSFITRDDALGLLANR